MNSESQKLRIKVVVGEGDSQTIKRLTKIPNDFQELDKMIHQRLKERLQHVECEDQCRFYYKDMSYGYIRISDSNDLRNALEYCGMYDQS